jgi:hypothetical protein
MKSDRSTESGNGVDEDKLEAVINQAVVTFLNLLCSLEHRRILIVLLGSVSGSPLYKSPLTYLAMRLFLHSS